MNTTTEPSTVTFDVPEYRELNFQAEYDLYMAQVRRDEYAFGPFTGGLI
jgi:hypothetical protein